jgi:8-hydroxy-5-deazaflavin:NADPH oxidoreductase
MVIAVLGTGGVGRTLAAKLRELGHEVRLGTRDPVATRARSAETSLGRWLEQHADVPLLAFDEVAVGAEVVVNATRGTASLEALGAVGAPQLAGKIVIDVANPLQGGAGLPTLFVSNDDSLAERIQAAFPEARVVKTLNTMTAALMVEPGRLGDGDHTVFLSGDDAEAKERVRELLASFGWRDILDLGDITTSRGPEMYLPLWLRLYGHFGTSLVSTKVVR